MPMQRMTSVKVRIKDLTAGQWVKSEGMVPSYIVTSYGDQVSRCRILGTVVSRFVSEDENFGSLTIDDSTDTIRVKTFKTVKPIENLEVGDMVDIVGKLREYNGEVYVMPESIRTTDINWEVLRKLEILSRIEKFGIKARTDVKEKEDKNLRGEILNIIGSSKEGIEFKDLGKNLNASESDIEAVINDLLSEGICYESRPGIIKKI